MDRHVENFEHTVIERVIESRADGRRRRCVGMRAAAVLLVDNMAVGRHLVAAHPEHLAQGSGHREQKTTVPAHPLGGPRHRRVGAVVALLPALGGVGAAVGAHHPAPPQADLRGDFVDLRITAVHISGHQARIVAGGGEQVAGPEIAGLNTLFPGHPLGSQQRSGARNQNNFADGDVVRAGVCGNHDSPLPPLITGEVRAETVGGRRGAFAAHAQVFTDGIGAAAVNDGSAGLFGGTSEQCSRGIGHIGHAQTVGSRRAHSLDGLRHDVTFPATFCDRLERPLFQHLPGPITARWISNTARRQARRATPATCRRSPVV